MQKDCAYLVAKEVWGKAKRRVKVILRFKELLSANSSVPDRSLMSKAIRSEDGN